MQTREKRNNISVITSNKDKSGSKVNRTENKDVKN